MLRLPVSKIVQAVRCHCHIAPLHLHLALLAGMTACIASGLLRQPMVFCQDAPNSEQIVLSGDVPGYAASCAKCHSYGRGDAFDAALERFEAPGVRDVHRQAELQCASCHIDHSSAAKPGARSTARECAACHGEVFAEYSSGKHGEAFDELGLPACATCHEPHGMNDPSTFDITLATEKGVRAEPSMCLSCHFAGSEFEPSVSRFAQVLAETDDTSDKLDIVLSKCGNLGRFIPRLGVFDVSGMRDGSYYRSRARAELHSLDDGIDANLVECAASLKKASGVLGRFIALYAVLAVLVLLILFMLGYRSAKTRKSRAPIRGE